MLATAIIVFREILEAALIISIVAAATQGVSRRGLWIAAGCLAGIAGAVVVAGLAEVIMELADGMGQELFNACILLAAVIMLAWHNIWMASHSKQLTAQMKQVGAAVKEEGEPMFALLLVVALAVLREGSEIVLFLHGQAAQGVSAAAMSSGGFAGTAAGAVLGLALYFGLIRIPVKHLFTVTAWMILLLAAGMASQAAKFLVQADMLPAWGSLWNTSLYLSNQSLAGSLLHTLVGYEARPMGIQAAVYVSTVLFIGGAMKVVNEKVVKKSAVKNLGVFILSAVFLVGMSASEISFAGPASHVYTPNVEYGETEFELLMGYAEDGGDGKSKRQYKLAVGHGVTQNWFTEIELEWEKEHGTGTEYKEWEWVNIFKLTEQGEYFVDLGLFTEFKFSDNHDKAEKLVVGPLFQKEFGAAIYNLNLFWVRDFGREAKHDTTFEYQFQARLRGEPALEYGFQAYGELGNWDDMGTSNNQEHMFGPAIFGVFKAGRGHDKIAWDTAFLIGATDDTSDYTLRFALEYEMY